MFEKTLAQVMITPAGDEPLVRIDPRAPDNGVNIRRAPPAAGENPGGGGEGRGDTFCAQLWLVSERGLFADAAKGRPLAFAPVRVVPRGRAFFAAVFFGNAAAANGAVTPSVSYDLAVRRPDGSLYNEKLGLVGSGGAPLPSPTGTPPKPAATTTTPRATASDPTAANETAPATAENGSAPSLPLRLGRDYLGIVIEPGDSAGLYTVEATVRDNVGRVELKLKTEFLVEAAATPAAPSPTP